MKTITLTKAQLKAALTLAPKDDLRFCLNGVHIEATDSVAYIVSTNGAALFVGKVFGEFSPCAVTIPYATVAAFLASKLPSCELRESEGAWSLAGLPFEPAGTYPQWRRVLPAPGVTEAVASYDPELLCKCAKALQTWTGRKHLPRVVQKGSATGYVRYPENDAAMCLVMPLAATEAPEPITV